MDELSGGQVMKLDAELVPDISRTLVFSSGSRTRAKFPLRTLARQSLSGDGLQAASQQLPQRKLQDRVYRKHTSVAAKAVVTTLAWTKGNMRYEQAVTHSGL